MKPGLETVLLRHYFETIATKSRMDSGELEALVACVPASIDLLSISRIGEADLGVDKSAGGEHIRVVRAQDLRGGTVLQIFKRVGRCWRPP